MPCSLKILFSVFGVLILNFGKAQITLAFQGGEAGDNWNYISSGADETAAAQAFLLDNIVSGSKSIVVGGNTAGGSCIDGGSGSGSSVVRFFDFETIDISTSNQHFRKLSFNYGNRLPVCVGTGWDTGEDLIFTAFHDGIAQTPVTLVVGNNNLVIPIKDYNYTHEIPPCVSQFSFRISINTNRRDELLILDDVRLTTTELNSGGILGTLVSRTICESELPYTWNGLTFMQTGQQSETYTNIFGCDSLVTYALTVTAFQTPAFSLFGPYCENSIIPSLPESSLNNISGTWSPILNNTLTTEYTFTPLVDQCAIPITRTIQIIQNEIPTFNALGPYCSGETIPDLPINSLNGILGSWSPIINNLSSTTYTFNPAPNQCATEASLTIEITPIANPSFDNIGPFCQGVNNIALPEESNNGIFGTWQPAFNNTITTTYSFTPNTGQCSNQASMEIQINPQFNVDTYVALCENQVPYTWNGHSLTTSGTYSVTLSSNLGCDSIVNLTLMVAPTAIISQNIEVCESDLPYHFFNQAIITPGIYSYTTNNDNQCDTTFILNLNIKLITPFDIANPPLFTCDSPIDIFFSMTGGQNATQCLWSSAGETLSNCDGFNMMYYSEGCYDVSLTITDSFGCRETIVKENIICILPSPVSNFSVHPNIAEIDDEIFIQNLSSGATDHILLFNNNISTIAQDEIISFSNLGDYEVLLIATNEIGCSDTSSQIIRITESLLMFVPNSFTPDGKLSNNIFLPIMSQGFNPDKYKLSIFNRWGELVFVSEDLTFGWDGTYDNKNVPEGVYIWQIEVQNSSLINEIHRGHINLIR
jgi:gliding motility-associated-like protein